MPRRRAKTDEPMIVEPTCPRCGYDLTGVVESWSDRCPIAGVCSECGYELAWRDVLNTQRFRLPWLYEHRTDRDPFRAFGTIVRVIQPWKFWKEVQVHHKVVTRRLIRYPVLLPFSVLIASVLLGILACYLEWIHSSRYSMRWHQSMPLAFKSIALQQFGFKLSRFTGFSMSTFSARPMYAVLAMFGFSMGMALVILIAKQSRRISRIRAVHVFRAVSYGMTPAMLLYCLYAAVWTSDQYIVGSGYSSQVWYSGTTSLLGPSPMWNRVGNTIWGAMLNPWVVYVAPLCWMAIWWFFALRDGFRMTAWWQVYIAGLIMGLVFAGFCLVNQGAWAWMYF